MVPNTFIARQTIDRNKSHADHFVLVIVSLPLLCHSLSLSSFALSTARDVNAFGPCLLSEEKKSRRNRVKNAHLVSAMTIPRCIRAEMKWKTPSHLNQLTSSHLRQAVIALMAIHFQPRFPFFLLFSALWNFIFAKRHTKQRRNKNNLSILGCFCARTKIDSVHPL